MNTLLRFGQTLFGHVLQATWQAAVLVVLILLAQFLLRRRLSAAWRYGLWLLVAARLLLPSAPRAAWSVFNVAGPPSWASREGAAPPRYPPLAQVETVSQSPAESQTATRGFRPEALAATEALPAVQTVAAHGLTAGALAVLRTLDWHRLALLAWLLGVCFCAARLLLPGIWFWHRISRAQPVRNEVTLREFDACRSELGLRQRVILAQTGEVRSPSVCGLWRKQLLLPRGALGQFSPGELRCIFLHELGHIKRRDLEVNWLVSLLQAVHWFNPLLWFAFARMRADREMACDALALAHLGKGSREAYGETILKTVEDLLRRPPAPGLLALSEDKRQLRKRIQMIAGFTGRPRLSVLAALVALTLMAVGLTDGSRGRTASAAAGHSPDGSVRDGSGVLSEGGQTRASGTQRNRATSSIAVSNPVPPTRTQGARLFLLKAGGEVLGELRTRATVAAVFSMGHVAAQGGDAGSGLRTNLEGGGVMKLVAGTNSVVVRAEEIEGVPEPEKPAPHRSTGGQVALLKSGGQVMGELRWRAGVHLQLEGTSVHSYSEYNAGDSTSVVSGGGVMRLVLGANWAVLEAEEIEIKPGARSAAGLNQTPVKQTFAEPGQLSLNAEGGHFSLPDLELDADKVKTGPAGDGERIITGEQRVRFRFRDDKGRVMQGNGDKVVFFLAPSGSGRVDAFALNGSPAALTTTNGTIENHIILFDANSGRVTAPGSAYRMTGADTASSAHSRAPKGAENSALSPVPAEARPFVEERAEPSKPRPNGPGSEPVPLYTREIRVDPVAFPRALQRLTGEDWSEAAEGLEQQPRVQVGGGAWTPGPTNSAMTFIRAFRQFAQSRGIDLSPPRTVFYSRRGLLFVRATLHDLDAIEQAVNALSGPVPRIAIQATLVQLPEAEARAFRESLSGRAQPASGAWTALLTASELNASLAHWRSAAGSMISQTNGTAPTGGPMELRFPTELALTVMPTLAEDRQTVRLEFSVRADLLGYVDPGQFKPSASARARITAPPKPRRVSTPWASATAQKGQTLAISGSEGSLQRELQLSPEQKDRLAEFVLLLTPTAPQAVDLLQPGQEVAWNDGQIVVRVAQRTGNSLKGIKVVSRSPDGQETVVTAENGTISPGSVSNSQDPDSVTLTLHEMKIQSGEKAGTATDGTFSLHQ